MTRRIIIDPITRLEGHGKIEIRLGSGGQVDRAFFQVPDFRGFEKFCEGRAAEEMPTLTQKICGVCPTAHHIASVKALDDLFDVEPTEAAKKIRELMHTAFIYEDHLLHFFYLGGPDILVGSDDKRFGKNIFGVIGKLGERIGEEVIEIRKRVRGLNALVSGSPLYPVCGLPGGVSKPVPEEERIGIKEIARDALAFARRCLKIFEEEVLESREYVDLTHLDAYSLETYYMGMVDGNNRVSFYDGEIRIVDPEGGEFEKFGAIDYLHHLEERVDTWSYMKTLYLKGVGWHGLREGKESGLYRVGPLARLNASEGLATPLAQQEYERMFDVCGGKPVHNTLVYHWARLIEVLYAAERMGEIAVDDQLTDPEIRNIPVQSPRKGVGICEAPRGTLIHHYETDEAAILKRLNLLVATQNNAGAISLSVLKAARAFIKEGRVSDLILNRIEMGYRAYDPCMACATH
ncbi:MAG: Ni/Fe hydrogenase subunit alpha [Deltaproteobacteria bacterium]|jgi:F420-non-reducing hydrogenase large subunit|nr:Ni/Fe hydrogenase subunit alpha [Deltaproteobacteria bacterium]